MTDWAKHWALHPKKVGKIEYLKQVGKTVGGKPILEWQFNQILLDIFHHLSLEKDDVVLDLCCGNGLITKELAKKCKWVVGVDFSQPLLEVANRDHRRANVSYLEMNVLNLEQNIFNAQLAPGVFDKILMYEALQYFRQQDLITLLKSILQFSSEKRVMLFGSVPDRKKIWHFYNTPQRRLAYLIHKFSGREAIGTWWDREFIERVCKQLSLQCEFHSQNAALHTSHYRFDVNVF